MPISPTTIEGDVLSRYRANLGIEANTNHFFANEHLWPQVNARNDIKCKALQVTYTDSMSVEFSAESSTRYSTSDLPTLECSPELSIERNPVSSAPRSAPPLSERAPAQSASWSAPLGRGVLPGALHREKSSSERSSGLLP